MTSRHYWPRRGHISWWKKMEVSLIVCGCSWPHSFPVGRIVCRENRRSAQSDTAPSHLPTLALPVDPTPDPPSPTDPDAPARRHLIKDGSPPHEAISPIKTTSGTTQMARIRGAPLVGRPLAALRATVPNPPPPAYVHPPRYDNSSPPDEGARPS